MGLTIATPRLVLQEITGDDFSILHAWRNESRFTTYCSTRRNQVSAEDFRRELASDFNRDRCLQCMILHRGIAIGTIYAYGMNHTDRYAFVTTYLTASAEHRGYGAEAFVFFVEYLFEQLDLYKIYSEVYEYNTHSLSCLRNAGLFSEEGRFKGHRKIGNQRYDLIRFACFRVDLPRIIAWTERAQRHRQNLRA